MTDITIGNDYELGVRLTKNGQPFNIDPQHIIKATVVSADNSARYFDPLTVSPAVPGTDLSQSLIIVRFLRAQTMAINKQGPAKIEIEITEDQGNGFKHPSWFVPVRCIKGQIL